MTSYAVPTDDGLWDNLDDRTSWSSSPCMMGIDEAGRGPVLGPMVYAAVVCPEAYGEELATKAYADSKTLTEAQREGLYQQVRGEPQLGAIRDSLSAAVLSAAALGRSKVSLNELAARSTCALIQRALDAGLQLRKVFIDTVGDPDRYKAKLQRSFPSLEFTVCPKADALFPVVSAASIVAKVTRDTAIAAVQAQLQAKATEGAPAVALGTGYPGDPNTQAWLAGNLDRVFGYHHLVRFAWDTTARLLADGAVKVTWDTDSSADPGGGGPGGSGGRAQATLGAFMPGGDASSESSGAGRHVFFRLRRLQRVKAF